MNQTLRKVFNDGILIYGHNQTERSETGKKIGDVFTEEGRLHFREVSSREQDYRLVDALSSTLDLKVETRYPPHFKNVQKSDLIIKINKVIYEVIRVDPDETKSFLFFYLQKVGEEIE